MKHLKELKYIIFLLAIFIAFVVIKKTKKDYFKITAQETHILSLNNDYILSEKDLENTTSNYLLIDIRKKELFNKSHLDQAINIPFENILEKSNTKRFKNNQKRILLYSDKISESIKARLILNQIGLIDIYVLDISEETMDSGKLTGNTVYNTNEVFKYKFQPDTSIKLE